MATEILRPQDCLARRMGASSPAAAAYPRRRSCGYGSSCSNPRPNRKHHQHQQRKPAASERSSPYEAGAASPGGGGLLGMGKVTILRRGEPLDAAARDDEAGSKRGGGAPEPEMARKQVGAPELRSPAAVGGKAVVYAGSAFAVSPEPSSLPLPSFSKKKKKQVLLVDDSATRDLRRLLRLDLL
ncbi:uncharacterized protein LOC115684980 [Syzygium oleosum]|uniref:uncharacterized protein LOC115684980 n=1 Tax=Syzygium oleosum TaxID=219896 RepID=UPI0011D24B1C|nr:uncharacterized protein LOC115684980 [Syzygium oleosum]